MSIQEPFADGQSLIHRLDPRVRLLAASIVSVTVALLESPAAMGTALALAISAAAGARLPVKPVARRLGLLSGFLILMWLLLPITAGGNPVGRLGPFAIGDRGIVLAAAITFKSTTILLVLMALVATMTVATLGNAMGRLRIPPKIIYLLLMTYRYIYVIESEYRRLVAALKIRGFVPKTSLHAYRTYAYLVGMLLVRAALRADRVHQAMVCRGFQGRFYTIGDQTLDRASVWFGGVAAAAVVVIIILEWGGVF